MGRLSPNFRSLTGKSFIFNVDISKSSLQVCKFDVGVEFQAEALKQDCLMVGGAADTALADGDACGCWRHDVD